MRTISAEEWQLHSFFEVEPSVELDEETVSWPFCDAVFRVSQGDVNLSFAIHPARKDVRILLSLRSDVLYELNAGDVHDVRYVARPYSEVLEIELEPANVFAIQVRPKITIEHFRRSEDIA